MVTSMKARHLAKTWLKGGYFYENHTKSVRCKECNHWVEVKSYQVSSHSHDLHDKIVQHVLAECKVG